MEFRNNFDSFDEIKLNSYLWFYHQINWDREVRFRSAFH